jgi:hypothetical protein
MQIICQFSEHKGKSGNPVTIGDLCCDILAEFYSGNEIENSHMRVYCPVGVL